jgi:hypothetical protein
MAGIVRTIIGGATLRLFQTFHIFAGVDASLNPQLVKINSDGRLLVDASTSPANIPTYDAITIEKYGSTNNIRYVRYRTGGRTGTIVATKQLFYVGNGVADNDVFSASEITIP